MTIEVDTFEFVERCRTHRSTEALLGDLLHAVSKVGFEHPIVSGVPAGNEAAQAMMPMSWIV
jgi:LuxR family quorum sensing-dependent transcriptional regulator